ncbi:Oligosaccharyltransferase PglB [hydrothermal vent metagenome]|uniref:Oligosaccharyltransferase PglB n=1 Tax=hydrothermal vent metagenome TaxID=652676 RepID=A0A1W1BIS9_9ZZZZ
MILSAILLILFLLLGNVFELIFAKVIGYIVTGTQDSGLHFYAVNQTVREAGQIPFETFANRISGSQWGVIIAFVGYIVLVLKHRAFILALPLIGIGGFALIGGLRFTVYAVPIAGMSAIYLFFVLGDFFRNKIFKFSFIVIATIAMIIPNINHIIGYKVPTVLNTIEVLDLAKLKVISDPKDYTLSWWDYGYPIWYYSDTSTLIDGGKHNNDNFLISKIMQTTSADFAVNLSRLSVETYVDSNYSIIANTLFRDEEKKPIDVNLALLELEDKAYVLPKKTRDIYLYLPYRMLNIFLTVSVFGNLDLNTGKKLRNIRFFPTTLIKNIEGKHHFKNGIIFDSKKGELTIGREKSSVKYFITTKNTASGNILLDSQVLHMDGKYTVIYMKSYRKFVIIDNETFNSMYIQMFILGKYDKDLFELVISSNYSKIYKLKK